MSIWLTRKIPEKIHFRDKHCVLIVENLESVVCKANLILHCWVFFKGKKHANFSQEKPELRFTSFPQALMQTTYTLCKGAATVLFK